MSDSAKKLTAKQEQALAALLLHPTLAEASKACKQSETTLRRYKSEDAFAEAYRLAQRQVMETALCCLQQATGGAVAALISIYTNKTAPAAARTAAARTVLDFAFRSVELLETNERLSSIEAMLKAQAQEQTS